MSELKITPQQIEHLGKLSRMELSEEEKTALVPQLQGILEYVHELEKISTDGVEPLCHPLDMTVQFREDDVQKVILDEQKRSPILDSAPECVDTEFKVPPIIK